MKDISKNNWMSKVVAAYKKDLNFCICAHTPTTPNNSRPLMIIVHPADAIEDGIGFANNDHAKEVIAFSEKNTIGMAAEIKELLPVADIIVVHRLSSVDLMFKRKNSHNITQNEKENPSYNHACLLASERGAVLYGDDIDLVTDWIIKNYDIRQREKIFMTGAYASENHGCITAIGKQLEERTGCKNISVSDYSPTDNANHSKRWKPQKHESIQFVRTQALPFSELVSLAESCVSDLLDDDQWEDFQLKRDIEKIQYRYLHSDCDYFAAALHMALQWPIVSICTSNGPVHRLVVDPQGRMLDAQGWVTAKDLQTRYRAKKVHISSPGDLSQCLSDIDSDEEIMQALEALKHFDFAPFNDEIKERIVIYVDGDQLKPSSQRQDKLCAKIKRRI